MAQRTVCHHADAEPLALRQQPLLDTSVEHVVADLLHLGGPMLGIPVDLLEREVRNASRVAPSQTFAMM